MNHAPSLAFLLSALSSLSIAPAAPAFAQAQPQVQTQTQPQAQPQTKPADSHAAASAKPAIYDEKANAREQIDAAIARAAKNNRRVLIQWGGNWCPWCHLLHEAMSSDAAIKKELQYEYDVVLVDIGRFDRNLDIASAYGADIKSGVPYITVLDSAGKPVINQETGSLESKEEGKHEHDRAAVLKFLKDHQAEPRKAQDLFTAGLSAAAKDSKRVFLHFGAPWCVYCHKLEGWMERPEIAALLSKAFVDVKIDTDRDIDAQEIMKKVGADPQGGIPWFAILDSSGKVLATSDAKGGNIGFPMQPAEIEHFLSMLTKSGASLQPADLKAIESSLKSPAPAAH